MGLASPPGSTDHEVMSYQYSVLVPFMQSHISGEDIRRIGAEISKRDPHLLWKPVELKPGMKAPGVRMPDIPSMLLQFHAFRNRVLPEFKGPRLEAHRVHKAKQLRLLEKAGLPVPPWTRLEPKAEVDPTVFGEFLIIKPSEPVSSKGWGVTLIRTSGFREFRDRYAPEFRSTDRSSPIVQKFIPTGPTPRHFRVMAFLARVILCGYYKSSKATPLYAPSMELKLTQNVASNAGEIQRYLQKDAEMMDLAKGVARVFESPVIGGDYVRCEETGKAYVLEANSGNTWTFSNELNRSTLEAFGYEAAREQFDLYSTVADAIVEHARSILGVADQPKST